MTHKANFFHVNAFTLTTFSGNPANVVILDKMPDATWMQSLAKEMQQPVVSFITRENTHYQIRWFYTEKEAVLCGHGTLAAAHILWQSGFEDSNQVIEFRNRNGVIQTRLVDGWINMTMPVPTISACEGDSEELLSDALQTEIIFSGKSNLDYIVEITSEQVLKNLQPNFEKLAQLDTRGVIATARSKDFDFESRFFSPRSNKKEDAVTGSAHAALFSYWNQRLNLEKMTAYQCSPRGGHLKLKKSVCGVEVGGQAVTLLTGHLHSRRLRYN